VCNLEKQPIAHIKRPLKNNATESSAGKKQWPSLFSHPGKTEKEGEGEKREKKKERLETVK